MIIFAGFSIVFSVILSYYKIPLKYLWWTFNGLAVTLFIPIIIALTCHQSLRNKKILKGLYLGIFIGCPFFLFGQFTQDIKISLLGIFLILSFNLGSLLLKKSKEN